MRTKKKKSNIERNVIPLLYPTTSENCSVGVIDGEIFKYDHKDFELNPFKYISMVPHHVYILSNDKINKGDYIYDGEKISKVSKVGDSFIYFNGTTEPSKKVISYKIVASTDKLIDLPLIGKGFINEIVDDFHGMSNVISSLVKGRNGKLTYDLTENFEIRISRIDKIREFEYLSSEDLMIGNFVYHQKDIYTILYGNDMDFADEYFPVKITDYWLRKLNFNRIDKESYKESYKNFLIKNTLDGFNFYLMNNDIDLTFVKSIKYVHEIQNLYKSITGVNIEHKIDING
tara:strand:- start:112 stop:975 length:864 start_codon:yes stop_codon:yes gene_type:complete